MSELMHVPACYNVPCSLLYQIFPFYPSTILNEDSMYALQSLIKWSKSTSWNADQSLFSVAKRRLKVGKEGRDSEP